MGNRDREAATWFARMRAPAADDHRPAFEAWRNDPRNAAAFARFEDDWALMADLSRSRIAAHAPKNETAVPRWALATATAMLLCIGLGWLTQGYWRSPDAPSDQIQFAESILADGTKVQLEDGARIETEFSEKERIVRMTGGKARFVVAKDNARPFRVIAGNSETIAIGTVFEIDLAQGRTVVRLIEGIVEVRSHSRTGQPVRLKPGQSAQIGAAGPKILAAHIQPAIDASRRTFMVADQMPLGNIITQANRTGDRPIRLADPALQGLAVSGRFDVGDGAKLARKLAAALDLELTENAGSIILGPVLHAQANNPGG